MNHGTVKAGRSLKGGCHPAGCNEGYYALRGRALLTLGGDPETGAGGTTYEIGPDTAIYIPGGTFHKLDNPYDEDFELLTMWPQIPPPGANGVYDQRRKAWGTDFRKKAPAG
jgi:mannose-6-phosphate isomerase-like protein (cupin superfamily)